jgi:4-amino-4-deoxy-L-arabinose transferase-like glycosyltransferase
MPSHRLAHHALLLAVTAALTLPNLGATSLWDVDEGVNAGCAKEMAEADTWVVPTFNGDLRTAKPVMLYWIQRVSFLALGVSEWSARLPAALLSMGTVLLVYELARRMFGPATGLLAGLVLASAIEFCKLAHAATPDAPLIFFTVLTFYLFWVGHENGRRAWFYPAAVASGLAVLTKGPIGLALPGLVVLLYFAWNRELRRLLDWRLIGGILLWAVVAVPWYALVISETRGAYVRFFEHDNANRFFNPMEGHRGPVVYYLGALVVFFAPWCSFLIPTAWDAVRGARNSSPPIAIGGLSTEQRACRFLLCWAVAYFVFFSAAATKLPNYIAPLYPAVAILTARVLVRWREGAITLPRWVMPAAVGGVAVTGVVVAAGLLVTGGVIPVSVRGLRVLPAVAPWAGLGLIFLAAAAAMGWFLHTGNRPAVVAAVTVASILFVGVTAALPTLAVEEYKAPKQLVAAAGACQTDREVRVASLDYTQPSVTFYAGRRVERLYSAAAAGEFLGMPLPAFLFVPEPVWAAQLAGKVPTPHRVAARRFDLLRNCHILVVTNQE